MATLSNDHAAADRIAAAERQMYNGELALHDAWQSGVDMWIAAAYEKLHNAIAEHTAAVGELVAG